MDTKDTQHNALDTPTKYSRSTTLVGSPSSPFPEKAAPAPTYHYWRIASAILCLFAVGWGDGATGAVLPAMQSHFQLDFVMASMLFVMGSAGCAFSAFFIEPFSHLLGRFHLFDEKRSFFPALFTLDSAAYSPSKGRHLILFISGLLHCIYFLFSACSSHYYGVLAAFFLGGIGKSILIAQAQAVINFYVTHTELLPFSNVFWTKNSRVIAVSILHRTYGIGAFFSPLVSQTIRDHGYPWRGFFWISLGLAALNVGLSLYAFHTTEAEFEMEKSLAIASDALSRTKFAAKRDIENAIQIIDEKFEGQGGISQIFKMPFVWAIAIFVGLYRGAETIAQGFIVTFLLYERNASHNVVGYALSGFWGGLVVGRLAWDFISPYYSQKAKIYYINFVLVLGIVFHVLIWKIDSMVANSVLVSLLGLITGPTFPLVLDIVTNQNAKQTPGKPSLLPVFPREIQPTALALSSFAGGLGGAIFPLAAGIAATEYGAFAVEPLAMATLGFVLVFWVGAQITSKIVRK